MFFACGIWCLADVSSVNSPSSEQAYKIKRVCICTELFVVVITNMRFNSCVTLNLSKGSVRVIPVDGNPQNK